MKKSSFRDKINLTKKMGDEEKMDIVRTPIVGGVIDDEWSIVEPNDEGMIVDSDEAKIIEVEIEEGASVESKNEYSEYRNQQMTEGKEFLSSIDEENDKEKKVVTKEKIGYEIGDEISGMESIEPPIEEIKRYKARSMGLSTLLQIESDPEVIPPIEAKGPNPCKSRPGCTKHLKDIKGRLRKTLSVEETNGAKIIYGNDDSFTFRFKGFVHSQVKTKCEHIDLAEGWSAWLQK